MTCHIILSWHCLLGKNPLQVKAASSSKVPNNNAQAWQDVDGSGRAGLKVMHVIPQVCCRPGHGRSHALLQLPLGRPLPGHCLWRADCESRMVQPLLQPRQLLNCISLCLRFI